MPLSSKLQALVDREIITREQAEKIAAADTEKRTNMVWKTLYWLAGLLVGLGVILLIGANWWEIPDTLKLTGDFILFGGILYGVYWSFVREKKHLGEFFLTLSFLMVGATIGLIAQIFNLNGGWDSFALSWAVLSLPFALASRLVSLNIVWLLVLSAGIPWGRIMVIISYIGDGLALLIAMTAFWGVLSYAGAKLYEAVGKRIVMPKALATLSGVVMYLTVLSGGAGLRGFGAHAFVFAFLAFRMALAVYRKDNRSFRNNTVLAEGYIFYLFLSQFRTLFATGVGFVAGGLLLLLMIYILKKTSNYIKMMEFE